MAESQIKRLLEILRHLRGPEGCAWDQQQDLASAARYLADEVFEYVETAATGDDEAAADELSDLFYMVAFNWLLLSERSGIDFEELARRGADKLQRRKPHVFGEAERWEGLSHEEIWRRTKARERGGDEPAPPSLLKDLHPSASALRQAVLHGRLAAKAGFDWSGPEPVVAKLHEELEELRQATREEDPAAVEEELGDLLFAVVQLGRKLGVDPDLALARTNRKFARRFRAIESRHDHDVDRLRGLGLEGLWREWKTVKRQLREEASSDDASDEDS